MREKEILSFIGKRLAVMALTVLYSLCVLCGCTQKEELILLTEDKQVQEVAAEVMEEIPAAAYIEKEPETVCVHVCGAVMTPGVYELSAGSRVYEAVQAAGGFAEDAEQSYVNQAQELSDGTKLVIPTVEEAEQAGQKDIAFAQEQEVHIDDGKVNINTASLEELCKIPGIGTTRAAAIMSYREEHGSFESIEDIMKVSGIKEGTYEKIKENISVK